MTAPSPDHGSGSGLLAPASSAPMAATVRTYPLSFTGSAAEFFRIWIVNVALTVLTLGIYTPWARVRTRQYFYGHTWLDGHNFEYNANPVALLKGYLIVALLFGLYTAAQQFEFEGSELVVAGLMLLFVALYPWTVRQSMRFMARSSIHRGLHFRFLGSWPDAYLSYGVANLAASLSLSLALPWAWFMQRRYQADYLSYGEARSRFRGEVGPFFIIGLTGLALAIAGWLLLALLFSLLIGTVGVLSSWSDLEAGDPESVSASVVIGAGMLLVLAILLLYGVAWQYIRAATMKYVLNNFELGGVVRTRATFNPWMLVWISVSNTVARVVSLGLLIPWATVRRNRYILEHVQVRAIASLDDFSASAVQDESALGEAATELLDIDLGF